VSLARTLPLLLVLLTAAPSRAEPPLCTLEPELSEAASALLEGAGPPSGLQLTAAVRAAASDAVGLHALFTDPHATSAETERWLADQRARGDAALVCGSAQSPRGRLLISSARGGSLAPIDPRRQIVRGSLTAGFERAELVLEGADGRLVRVGVNRESLARGVLLPDDLPAPIKVQLVASGVAGPRPVAERTMVGSHGERRDEAAAEGGEPDRRLETASSARLAPERSPASVHPAAASGAASAPERPPASVHPAAASGASPRANDGTSTLHPDQPPAAVDPPADPAAAGELTRMLLDLRRVEQRGQLRDNRLLRQAATEHARAVCREGRVAHEVTRGEGPEQRLAEAGLSARLLGEVIARSVDAGAALTALSDSPSHRLTLLEPRFTDVGVGVANDASGKRCFVVLLCAWPRYVGR
jgi:uncharacterized protein YkwD